MDRTAEKYRWRRWTLRSIMLAVAIVAVLITLARPLFTPPAIRAARDVLDKYGKAGDPGFRPGDYEAKRAVLATSGYWRVEFERIAGSGKSTKSVIVPSQAVDKYRFNPWR